VIYTGVATNQSTRATSPLTRSQTPCAEARPIFWVQFVARRKTDRIFSESKENDRTTIKVPPARATCLWLHQGSRNQQPVSRVRILDNSPRQIRSVITVTNSRSPRGLIPAAAGQVRRQTRGQGPGRLVRSKRLGRLISAEPLRRAVVHHRTADLADGITGPPNRPAPRVVFP